MGTKAQIKAQSTEQQREAAKYGVPIILSMLVVGGGVAHLLLSFIQLHWAAELAIGIVVFALVAHQTGIVVAKGLDRFAEGDDGAE